MEEKEFIIKINKIEQITHDVKKFICDKPENYNFVPGQATEVGVNKESWQDRKRPFTFSNLPSEDFLEFVIKIYPDHEGVTNEIDKLVEGDEFVIGESWGAIHYKGKGVFIAGGAGVTPFISILRDLNKKDELEDNVLLFSNKTSEDIILKEEFESILGDKAIFNLTNDGGERIDIDYVKSKVGDLEGKKFYVCGPKAMVKDIREGLAEEGVSEEDMVFEK